MQQQLKLTIYISLVVTLFFAFRAQAQLQPQSQKIDNHRMTDWVKVGVPDTALKKALAYEANDPHADDKDKAITNKDWLTIIDYTAPSSQQRMFVINLKTGEVIKSFVTHGEGSDDGHGRAVKFSNIDGSLQTTPGFLKIGDQFVSPTFGPAFKLQGLEDRNSAAESRLIIMHAADYTSSDFVKAHGSVGLSQGCPAVPPEMLKMLYSKNIPGSLLYGYTSDDAK